jgi:hypothetical protein
MITGSGEFDLLSDTIQPVCNAIRPDFPLRLQQAQHSDGDLSSGFRSAAA